MRLLFIHSRPFSYKVTGESGFAEPLSSDVRGECSVADALVALVAVEAQDENSVERVVATAAMEIEKVLKRVGADTVVLYPYSHLSNSLSAPQVGLGIVKRLRDALAHHNLVRAPFGWHKSFQLNGVGHPASELSRVIEIVPGQVVRALSRGHEHPVAALVQSFRQVLLELGLDESVNRAIIDIGHIDKQHGGAAAQVLDRTFLLSGLERAKLELSEEKLRAASELLPGVDTAALEEVAREYNGASIAPDSFAAELSRRLNLDAERTAEVMEKVFPEFHVLQHTPLSKTLRSDATTNWLPMMRNVRDRLPLPVRMFSIVPRYHRLPRQDPDHLFEGISASIAVMDDSLDIDDGRHLARDILKKLGFNRCAFVHDPDAPASLAPDTAFDIIIKNEGENTRAGRLGFFSSAAIDAYGLKYPVFNIDFEVERIALLMSRGDDLRTLMYPLMYEKVSYDDREIAALLKPKRTPADEKLALAAKNMAQVAAEKCEWLGPAELKLYEGPLAGRRVEISVFSWDRGKAMLSLAAMNEVFVHEGSIYGLPRDRGALGDKFASIYERGVNTGLRFLDLIILGYVAEAERRSANRQSKAFEERWKIAKHPVEINLDVPDDVADFIRTSKKAVKIGGPLFFGLRTVWK